MCVTYAMYMPWVLCVCDVCVIAVYGMVVMYGVRVCHVWCVRYVLTMFVSLLRDAGVMGVMYMCRVCVMCMVLVCCAWHAFAGVVICVVYALCMLCVRDM